MWPIALDKEGNVQTQKFTQNQSRLVSLELSHRVESNSI